MARTISSTDMAGLPLPGAPQLSIYPALFALTDQANTSAICVVNRVLCVVRMALRAMRYAGRRPLRILLGGYLFKVMGVHAELIEASMVNLHAVSDGAIKRLVRHSVCEQHSFTAPTCADMPVPSGHAAWPRPTFVVMGE